ncbi:hypothetical protein [Lentilitoribacter sp. EG35]|uniref:hypothetical protein n=1 Tax=Lentilitoribacter sp. EG35 TaxID=3234192 RepID=UPI00346074B6
MTIKEVTQQRASGLLIAIGIVFVLFLIFAVNMFEPPVRQDLTGSTKNAPTVNDWKGNSGSLPYSPPSMQ